MKFEITAPREDEDKALMAAITPDSPITYISNEVAAGELRLIFAVNDGVSITKFGFHIYDAYAEMRAKLNDLATKVQAGTIQAPAKKSKTAKNESAKTFKSTKKPVKKTKSTVRT